MCVCVILPSDLVAEVLLHSTDPRFGLITVGFGAMRSSKSCQGVLQLHQVVSETLVILTKRDEWLEKIGKWIFVN